MMARKYIGHHIFLATTALLPQAGQAAAGGFTITEGQVVTTTQELNAPGDVGIVERGGVVDVDDGSYAAILSSAEDVTIRNAGDVSVKVATDSFSALGISATANSTVINSGRSVAVGTGAIGVAAGIQALDGSRVFNSGVALGSVHGIATFGVGISLGSNAELVNTGVVSGIGAGTDSNPIGISGSDDDTIENAGAVHAQSTGSSSEAIGISFYDHNHLLNTGSIAVTATGASEAAYGIYAHELNDITNRGDIVVEVAGDGGLARGVSAYEKNAITNSGLIDVSVTGDGGDAMGMWAAMDAPTPGEEGNDILNTGVMRVSAEGAGAGASGVIGYIGNAITNTGTMSIVAKGDYSHTTGVGFLSEGSFRNSGQLSVRAIGARAASTAVSVRGGVSTLIANSGRISSSASGTAATATGIDMDYTSFDNTGLMTVTAAGDSATAYGMRLGVQSQVINTGVITASATGANAESYGIFAEYWDNTITNCGTIVGGTAAVKFEGTGNTLSLCKGNHIEGSLLLGDGNSLNVDLGHGSNAALHYEGSPTVTVSNVPHVVAGNTIAVVDPTGFAAENQMLTDLTRVISDSVDARLDAARANRVPNAVALNGAMVTPVADVPPGTQDSVVFWVSAMGQTRDEYGDGTNVGFDSRLGGLMLGADGEVSSGIRAGAFLGTTASALETDTDSQTIEADSYFGGIYAGLRKGAPFLNLAVTAGASDQNSDRKLNDNLAVGGTDHAKANDTGGFISPAATLGADIALPGAVLTPSIRAQYAALFLNGYDEHGSSADLSVDSRTVQVFDLRGQLAFAVPVALESGTLDLTTRLGADTSFASNSDVNTQLLGETLDLQVDGQNAVEGFAGFDLGYTTAGGTRFFATTEFGVQQDASTTAQASAGLELQL